MAVALTMGVPPGTGSLVQEEPSLLEEVSAHAAGVSRLEMCIQCGSCGGSCPSASAMEHTPRALIALLRAGRREEALRSNTFWLCVSCYHCVVRCPQEVQITDVMYALKRMAIEASLYQDATAPDFSQTFIGMVEGYGRSYEAGLASIHYIKHFALRLPSMAPMAVGMLSRRRMNLRPTRIRNLRQLKAILKRAKELEARR